MALTWSQWQKLCPNAQLVDHPVVVAFARALLSTPESLRWLGDGISFYPACHVAFALLLKLRVVLGKAWDNPTGIVVYLTPQTLDDRMECPGFYKAIYKAGLIASSDQGSFKIKTNEFCDGIGDHVRAEALERAGLDRTNERLGFLDGLTGGSK